MEEAKQTDIGRERFSRVAGDRRCHSSWVIDEKEVASRHGLRMLIGSGG